MTLRQELEGKPALPPRPMYYLITAYSFTDCVSEKETLKDRLQEWEYDRIGREGIKLDEDSLTSGDGKRQIGFDVHFICLTFKVKLSDFSVKYTAHTAVSTLRVKKRERRGAEKSQCICISVPVKGQL